MVCLLLHTQWHPCPSRGQQHTSEGCPDESKAQRLTHSPGSPNTCRYQRLLTLSLHSVSKQAPRTPQSLTPLPMRWPAASPRPPGWASSCSRTPHRWPPRRPARSSTSRVRFRVWMQGSDFWAMMTPSCTQHGVSGLHAVQHAPLRVWDLETELRVWRDDGLLRVHDTASVASPSSCKRRLARGQGLLADRPRGQLRA